MGAIARKNEVVMDTIWTTSDFTTTDLDGKTVEFQIPTRDGILAGVGIFSVRQNPDGSLRESERKASATRH